MKQHAVNIIRLSVLAVILTGTIWSNQKSIFSISYVYGPRPPLPSLIANSQLEYYNKTYSDLWVEGAFQVSEKVTYEGALELTDQPHEFILTKYSRPDYPLSTGRVQKSVVRYISEEFLISMGRDDMISGRLRPSVFQYPLYADGFDWNYTWDKWSFRHIFQVLPAEKQDDLVFRRSLSYHHLTRSISGFTLGVGEYLILSGNQIGMDLKRLNPFLPFALNSHDSEADYYPGYIWDSDNSIIKFFVDWSSKTSKVSMCIYIDEFQIDDYDREVKNDAMLLSFSAENNIETLGSKNCLKWGFSVSNPNFGQHGGPFTTATIGAYPFLEHSPGIKSLTFFEAILLSEKAIQLSIGGYSERWVNISEISPDRMNLHVELNQLSIYSDSRFSIAVHYASKKWPLSLGLKGWLGSESKVSSGAQLNFQYTSGKPLKQ